jgi:hypothetical protein
LFCNNIPYQLYKYLKLGSAFDNPPHQTMSYVYIYMHISHCATFHLFILSKLFDFYKIRIFFLWRSWRLDLSLCRTYLTFISM